MRNETNLEKSESVHHGCGSGGSRNSIRYRYIDVNHQVNLSIPYALDDDVKVQIMAISGRRENPEIHAFLGGPDRVVLGVFRGSKNPKFDEFRGFGQNPKNPEKPEKPVPDSLIKGILT